MNIVLWILQVLLALHTAIGAVWKFSNSEQGATSLEALPHVVWLGLIPVEFVCAAALLLPAMKRDWGKAAPIAAICIAAEMLMFSAVHLASGATDHAPMIYWLVVAGICAGLAAGRLVVRPIR